MNIRRYKAYLLKGSAALFNLCTLWLIFFLKGPEWANSYYNIASLSVMIAVISRVGYDLVIAYSVNNGENKIYLNPANIAISIIGAFILSILLEKLVGWGESKVIFLAILTCSAVAIFEGVIRAHSEDDWVQILVLVSSNALLIVFSSIDLKIWNILMLVNLGVVVLYYGLIRKMGKSLHWEKTIHPQFTISTLTHSLHGLVNQNYITYFLTKYLNDTSLPIVHTILRIFNLSMWPLSYYTFSNVGEKSSELNKFRYENKNILLQAIFGSTLLVIGTLAFMGELKYIVPAFILAVGIFSFSLYGFSFFYKIRSRRFYAIMIIQIIIVTLTFAAGHFGVLTLNSLVALFAFYLLFCSFSHKLYRL
jgi:hypothetical protein